MVEHLPSKQEVTGSNPVTGFFIIHFIISHLTVLSKVFETSAYLTSILKKFSSFLLLPLIYFFLVLYLDIYEDEFTPNISRFSFKECRKEEHFQYSP